MMIDKGANPFVVDYYGRTEYKMRSLSDESLSNLPQKSCYFPVRKFPGFPHNPWNYENGVFQGRFGDVIGRGGEGIVIGGVFNGEKMAFKFVEIGRSSSYEKASANLKTQLSEMNEMQSTPGSCILPIKLHFR